MLKYITFFHDMFIIETKKTSEYEKILFLHQKMCSVTRQFNMYGSYYFILNNRIK
jgi:hypothetical protein